MISNQMCKDRSLQEVQAHSDRATLLFPHYGHSSLPGAKTRTGFTLTLSVSSLLKIKRLRRVSVQYKPSCKSKLIRVACRMRACACSMFKATATSAQHIIMHYKAIACLHRWNLPKHNKATEHIK